MVTARRITLWAGVALFALGAFGLLFVGSGNLLGIFPVNVALEIGYIATGAWLAVASSDDRWTHNVSAWVGVVYSVLGVIGLLAPDWGLFGLVPIHGMNVVLFIVLGGIMLYDWFSTPDATQALG